MKLGSILQDHCATLKAGTLKLHKQFVCYHVLEVLVLSQCAFVCNLSLQTSKETNLLLPCQDKSNKNIAVGHLNATWVCSLGKRLINLASRWLCFYNYCILFCHLAFCVCFSLLAYLMVSVTSEDSRHLEKYSRKPILTPQADFPFTLWDTLVCSD